MSVESALKKISDSLHIDKESIVKLINFESAFDPLAKNPYSGARGIIQFTHDTARTLGFKDADDLVKKNPTIEKQLKGPVLQYLKKYAPFNYPYPQSLYLSVFYPAYRYMPPDTVFDAKITMVNPGIKKISDYVSKVEGKTAKIKFYHSYSVLGFLIPITASALAVTYYIKRRPSDEQRRIVGECT